MDLTFQKFFAYGENEFILTLFFIKTNENLQQ